MILPNITSHHVVADRCATNRYFQVIGSIHDIESLTALDNTFSLNQSLFTSHWAHLSIILLWLSSIFFHLGFMCTYTLWVNNPLASLQISHGIWDPHFSNAPYLDHPLSMSQPTHQHINTGVVLSYSGVYNVIYTLGFTSVTQIYSLVLILDLASVVSIILAECHSSISMSLVARPAYQSNNLMSSLRLSNIIPIFITLYLASPSLRISSNTHMLLSGTQLLWSAHLIDIILSGTTSNPLTFVGGLKSDTASLMLSDISHHHSSLPILIQVGGLLWVRVTYQHDLYLRAYSSIALSPSPLAYKTTANITSQHPHSLPSLSTPSHDLTTSSSSHLHHSWIASITTLASFLSPTPSPT
jgi:photosystem I P700 chlorophyll a apoprotein A2